MSTRESVEIRTADGVASGRFYVGESGSPGVIHLTDAGGLRPSHVEMARRLADEGFAVLVPNIFYRVGEPPFFTPPINVDGEADGGPGGGRS